MPHLSMPEVGLVASGLYRNKLTIKTEQAKLRNVFLYFMQNVKPIEVKQHPYEISNVAKFLRERGSFNFLKMGEIRDKFQRLMPELPYHTNIR